VSIITPLPAAFQDLFDATAKRLGRDTGFIVRQRAFGATDFLTTVVFGYLHDSQATFATLAAELGLSESGLQQRFDQPETLAFLQAVLKAALEVVIVARPERLRALRHFHGVYLTDSTTLPLPAALAVPFAGCGGGANNHAPVAMLKILVTYEAQTGAIHALTLHAGKDHDNGLPWVDGLPPGSLHLTDLGFYCQERLRRDHDAGNYWISRLSCATTVRAADAPVAAITEIGPFLAARAAAPEIDEPVILGAANHAHPLAARLVAWRCTPADAERRRRRLYERAKTEKKKVTPAMLALCCWMVYVTNVPAPELRPKQIGELYRIRWQIELVFKRWKSWLALAKPIRKTTAGSALVELHARLLGVVVSEWVGMACGGPFRMPLVHVVKAVKKWGVRLGELLRQGVGVAHLLAQILRRLHRFRPRSHDPSNRVKTRNRLGFKVNFA
jgi:Transposase DDE domain